MADAEARHNFEVDACVCPPGGRRAHDASRLARPAEELERDAVGITEAHARSVRSVFDAAVLDAHFVEATSPLFEFDAVLDTERHVVEPDAIFAETFQALASDAFLAAARITSGLSSAKQTGAV